MIDQLLDASDVPALNHLKPERITLPIVSIVIPALNEQRYIESCLASLVALKTPQCSVEVVLVDNGSTDRTIELAEPFQNLLNLTILRLTGVRISALRNYGASQTSGDIVVFLDADCVAKSDWLTDYDALEARMTSAGVLGAAYEIPSESTWVALAWEQGQSKSGASEVRYVPGGGMFIRREVFVSLGGFDESLETNEDAELCRRVKERGLPVIADKSMAVLHLGTSQTLSDFYRRQRWHGAHVWKVFLRSPGQSGNERAIFLAVYTLTVELMVAVSLVIAVFTASWLFFALSLFLWLAPSLFLAFQRGLTSRRLSAIPALVALYMTYSIARARCLIAPGKRER